MGKFKIYTFVFKGLWMGGQILVVSKSEEEATKHARKRVDEMGYPKDKITFKDVCEISEGAIPYEDNGDY